MTAAYEKRVNIGGSNLIAGLLEGCDLDYIKFISEKLIAENKMESLVEMKEDKNIKDSEIFEKIKEDFNVEKCCCCKTTNNKIDLWSRVDLVDEPEEVLDIVRSKKYIHICDKCKTNMETNNG